MVGGGKLGAKERRGRWPKQVRKAEGEHQQE
jgi:hypothetical protein